MGRTTRPTGRTSAGEPIVELDRWQLTGALLGFGLIVVLVFFAGVIVGKGTSSTVPADLARIAGTAEIEAPTRQSMRERSVALASVEPSTGAIDRDLSRPPVAIPPSDPTDAARIEAHRQLQRSRAEGVAGVRPAEPSAVDGGGLAVAPSAGTLDGEGAQRGFTLQVSAFESKETASMVASELTSAGHPAHLREVTSAGRAFFRVEVGSFASAEAAGRYQRQFERASGYSTVLVAVN